MGVGRAEIASVVRVAPTEGDRQAGERVAEERSGQRAVAERLSDERELERLEPRAAIPRANKQPSGKPGAKDQRPGSVRS